MKSLAGSSNTVCVLDASAALAFLKDEPGSEIVEALLQDDDITCYMHAINLYEVRLKLKQAEINAIAASTPMSGLAPEVAVTALRAAGVRVRRDLGDGFLKAIVELRLQFANVGLADCACAAQARRLKAELVTSDRRDFAAMAAQGICAIRFIR